MKDEFLKIIDGIKIKQSLGVYIIPVLAKERAAEDGEILCKQKMKEFAEWILIQGFEKYQDGGKCWWGKFHDEKDYTTDQLINEFLKQ